MPVSYEEGFVDAVGLDDNEFVILQSSPGFLPNGVFESNLPANSYIDIERVLINASKCVVTVLINVSKTLTEALAKRFLSPEPSLPGRTHYTAIYSTIVRAVSRLKRGIPPSEMIGDYLNSKVSRRVLFASKGGLEVKSYQRLELISPSAELPEIPIPSPVFRTGDGTPYFELPFLIIKTDTVTEDFSYRRLVLQLIANVKLQEIAINEFTLPGITEILNDVILPGSGLRIGVESNLWEYVETAFAQTSDLRNKEVESPILAITIKRYPNPLGVQPWIYDNLITEPDVLASNYEPFMLDRNSIPKSADVILEN